MTDAPWVINQQFLDKHKIDFVTHDALPYSDASGQANDVYDFVRCPWPVVKPFLAVLSLPVSSALCSRAQSCSAAELCS